MAIATFPQRLYTTQRTFNDYGAADMQFGDISESRLKNEFRLTNISNLVDPYNLTRLTAFNNPQSRFAGVYGKRKAKNSISVQECTKLLFEEMQVTSFPFACVGPYKYLINKMLRHFEQSTGAPFKDMQLNDAYKQRIVNDNSPNSTKLAIQQEINDHIDYKNCGYPQERLSELTKIISSRVLPKFDSLIMDNINGMGITIHDVHATRIDIVDLVVNSSGWKAQIKYTGQDHFGLDIDDICKPKFNQFQFFRIWFVLQRYDKFGFRPFLTSLEATVDIEGSL
ncbi:DUF3289 family protein [Rouxiella sp. Mn2063]|uniref:DUF3289 family protein n=1 Tax=Rouxiella sp. Mn2063 TaxID=3395262 RepID=UPI003BD64E46